jgi:Protein of unknown function (DUF3224)
MTKRFYAGVGVIMLIWLFLCFGSFGSAAYAQPQSSIPSPAPDPVPNAVKKGGGMTTHASGPFEVKLNPQAPEDKVGDPTVVRMSIDKQFHGDLEATSKGQMLTAMTDVKGSAGYVAIERVTGTLRGRSGGFALQHSGTMTRGVPQLSITVVPDSGTGQLVGIAGKMEIKIADGKHSYDLEYTIAAP